MFKLFEIQWNEVNDETYTIFSPSSTSTTTATSVAFQGYSYWIDWSKGNQTVKKERPDNTRLHPTNYITITSNMNKSIAI